MSGVMEGTMNVRTWGWVVMLAACGGAAPEPKPEAPKAEKPLLPPPAKPVEVKVAGLGEMKIPADNPQTEAKVKLGHQLFFDKRLSSDGSRSCYSCHLNEDGNGGHDPIAVGAAEKKLTRHSPVIWNVGYLPLHYWDGRSPTLEAQATGAWSGGNMGVGKEGLAAKAAEIGAIPGYAEQFAAVFPGKGATPETVVQALAAYERTLVCDSTPWDRAQAGDPNAMTPEQKAGEEVFNGKAGCIACHAPPFFSAAYGAPEGVFYNLGIGTAGKPEAEVDVGRMSVTKADSDWASFKIPSLRNVARSAPYFHDGSAATLQEAVLLMAQGGVPNKNLSKAAVARDLSEDDVLKVVAFLSALDCDKKLEEPKLP